MLSNTELWRRAMEVRTRWWATLSFRSKALWILGYTEAAVVDVRQAIDIAQQQNSRSWELRPR
jgi:hypothetical protein